MKFRLLFVAVALGAVAANARTLKQWRGDDLISNPYYLSPNGQSVVVVRAYPIGDFAQVRLDSLVDFYNPNGWEWPRDDDPLHETAAWYAMQPDGTTGRLLAELKIPEDYEHLLVADSGRVMVGGEPDVLLTFYAADGSIVRSLRPDDVFTARDVDSLSRRGDDSLNIWLEDELVLISPREETKIYVRVEDGALVEEKRDHLPYPAVIATATRELAPAARFVVENKATCFDGVARIASERLVERAIERPLPPFPPARAARGRVWVEVVVSETGDVTCARATRFPFGFSEAALNAARLWKFMPYEIDGRAVAVTSEILFDFTEVDPESTIASDAER